jgi:hypothetical protein
VHFGSWRREAVGVVGVVVDVGGLKLVVLDEVGRETRIFRRWRMLTELAVVAVAVGGGKREEGVVGTSLGRCIFFSLPSF